MDTINLSRKATGGYMRTINGASPRFSSGIKYDTDSDGVRLFTDTDVRLTMEYMVPAAWTIQGETGFATVEEVCQALDMIRSDNFYGVCSGTDDIVPSDENDLLNPGFIEATLLEGDVHLLDMKGKERTRHLKLNTPSRFKVRKVFAAGTTPGMGLVSYYE